MRISFLMIVCSLCTTPSTLADARTGKLLEVAVGMASCIQLVLTDAYKLNGMHQSSWRRSGEAGSTMQIDWGNNKKATVSIRWRKTTGPFVLADWEGSSGKQCCERTSNWLCVYVGSSWLDAAYLLLRCFVAL